MTVGITRCCSTMYFFEDRYVPRVVSFGPFGSGACPKWRENAGSGWLVSDGAGVFAECTIKKRKVIIGQVYQTCYYIVQLLLVVRRPMQ